MKRTEAKVNCSENLDKVLQKEKLTREDFFKICSNLESENSNKKFFDLYDIMLKQRAQKEEEHRKKVNSKSNIRDRVFG